MKLDDYSFEFHQQLVDKCHISACVTLSSTYPHVLTLLTVNSFLIKHDDCLASLSYSTVYHLSTRS